MQCAHSNFDQKPLHASSPENGPLARLEAPELQNRKTTHGALCVTRDQLFSYICKACAVSSEANIPSPSPKLCQTVTTTSETHSPLQSTIPVPLKLVEKIPPLDDSCRSQAKA